MIKLPLCLFSLFFAVHASAETWKLLGDFEDGWRKQWVEKKFTRNTTEYRVVRKQGTAVLLAQSKNSASGLWRMLDIHPVESGTVSWRWEVDHSLPGNRNERKKQGDDYAARVFVVFEPHFLNWKTRSLCYVWASQQAQGSVYASPFASNVGTIVLQSGDQFAGKWIVEKRDFVADYKIFFGEPPTRVSAVAFMVDTDNTGSKATAYFDDIVLTIPDSRQTPR
jgi:Protein of unknown function (DUF3047)